MPRSQVNTLKRHKWYKPFLESLDTTPNVSRACRAAGISRTIAYRMKEEDEKFAEAWTECIEKALDGVEEALIDRAGHDDTTAAIFLLKSHRPKIYRETTKLEHSGPDGERLSIEFVDRILNSAKGE